MTNHILSIFPSFGEGLTGGIETSGEIAHEAITRFAESRNRNAYLLCYGRVPGNAENIPNAAYATTKIGALVKSITTTVRPRLIFVWHLSLLRLVLPLLSAQPKIIVFLHGIEGWRQQDRFTQFLLRYVDTFLSNSAYTWERFLKYQPQLEQRKHHVVPLGLGIALDEAPSGSEEFRMLMLSRLSLKEDYKGHRELITVWTKVLEQLPRAQLIIAGEGDLRPVLEQIVIDAGLTNAIKLLGYVTEETKQELLIQCHCLAMPSLNEGFGLVYLEAMRLGRPCLVSTVDAGREVVNPPEAGLAVDIHDDGMMVEAVRRLLAYGSEWDTWSIAAKRRYDQYYTKEHFISRLISILEMHE